MNTNQTLEQLKQLKLQGMSQCYEAILDMALHEQPEAHALIGMLAEAEASQRVLHRTQLYTKLAKLRYSTHLEQINCTPGRGITKEQLMLLADGSYIERSENILITGATGCGKSYLACALGKQACMKGYRALYYSMNRLIEQLSLARLDGTYIKWLNQIARVPLLILDDFGLQPVTHEVKIALLQILEDRYGKGATIVTAQLPVANWYEYLNEPTIADAICDRLTAKAHRIKLEGSSLRKQKNN
ncbi:MAG: ATP-binding protein [Sphingobacteriales bacterium]|nr:MAG: ATP-binding protein [Sphingobacteriales bacterium]